MPEYVWIIGLMLGALHVYCQAMATNAACQTCKRTCALMDEQIKAMKEGL